MRPTCASETLAPQKVRSSLEKMVVKARGEVVSISLFSYLNFRLSCIISRTVFTTIRHEFISKCPTQNQVKQTN